MKSIEEKIRDLKCEIFDISELQQKLQEEFGKLAQVKQGKLAELATLKKEEKVDGR